MEMSYESTCFRFSIINLSAKGFKFLFKLELLPKLFLFFLFLAKQGKGQGFIAACVLAGDMSPGQEVRRHE